MPKANQFLSEQDEIDIIEAIKKAELNTSGEIRIHIEGKANKDFLLSTQLKNGGKTVLNYKEDIVENSFSIS